MPAAVARYASGRTALLPCRPADRYRGPGDVLQALRELAEEAAAGLGGGEAAARPAGAAEAAGGDVIPDSQEEEEAVAGGAPGALALAPAPAAAPPSVSAQQPVFPETASADGGSIPRLRHDPSSKPLPAVAEEAEEAAELDPGEAAVPQQDGSEQEFRSQQARMQSTEQRAALAAAAEQEAEAAVAAAAVPAGDTSGPLLAGGRRFGVSAG